MIPKSNVQEVLKKHVDLAPKLTVVFSILANGSVTYDFSVPGSVGELLLIERLFNLEIDKFISGLHKGSPNGNPTSH